MESAHRPVRGMPRSGRGAAALALALSLSAAGCARGMAQRVGTAGPPPPVRAEWTGLVGAYRLGGDTVSVLEREGRLYLESPRGTQPLEPGAGDAFRVQGAGAVRQGTLLFSRDVRGLAVFGVAGPDTLRPIVVGPEQGTNFRIDPLRPVEELRREALAARPPVEGGEFRQPDLVELTALDSTIHLDVRYATTNNFMGARFYDRPRAFLQRPAAEALVRAHRRLLGRGYGVLVHDAYRPWYVTRMFWDATPDSQKVFVADPSRGSRHNRGAAVDLSLYDARTGRPVDMVSGYDEFSPRAYPDYAGGTSRQRWHRELLREVMEEEGFTVYDAEWWHFDFGDWRSYPIMNLPFDRISG